MVVISLFDKTGNMVRPWANAGYQCYCVDISHEQTYQDGNVHYVKADIMDCISKWYPIGEEAMIAFAFPPCTHTAVSGSSHFQRKGAAGAAEAFRLIARAEQLLNAFNCPYFFEQPVATTSTYCGKPSHTFNPCDYAGYLINPDENAYTKKTCLWSGNGFIMPEPKAVEPVNVCKAGSWIMQLGGSSERTKQLRSATPKGFAQAVFEANKAMGGSK